MTAPDVPLLDQLDALHAERNDSLYGRERFAEAVNHLPRLTAALRAVQALADEADAKVRRSVPAAGAEAVISRGAHTVSVADLRTTLAALDEKETDR